MLAGLELWRGQEKDVNQVAGWFPAEFVQQQVPVVVLMETSGRACLRKKSSVIIPDSRREEEQRVKELEYEELMTGASSGPARCRTAEENKGHSLFFLDGSLSLSGIFNVNNRCRNDYLLEQ